VKVNKNLDKIYFDPVAKYKEVHGFNPEMTIDDQMIRWYDSWQSPPLTRWFTPQDVKFVEDVAVSPTLTTHPIEKYHLLDEFMASRGFKTEIGGTNRRFYSSIEFPQFGAKISTSFEGFKNNKDEFNVQHVLKPYCTKVYDITQSGAIALDEVGIRVDKDSIVDYGDQIFDILDIVFRRRKIAMTDVGIATPKQWVIRRNFGPILCDFPSVVILDPKKCYCTKRIKRHGIEMPCNGLIDFDLGFNKMECTVCGQKYEIKSLMATNATTINRNTTYVKGGSNRKGELSNMSIEIIFDTDDVIIDGVSQKTKQVVTPSRASSFIDMEHAPKAAPESITPPVISGPIEAPTAAEEGVDQFIESMNKLTAFASDSNNFSSGLRVMAEDDEDEVEKEEEVIDVEEDETTPVEHFEGEVIEETSSFDDTAVLNSYSDTAEVLADSYKGELEGLDEDDNNEDNEDDYITRDEFDKFATSIYNKINELEGTVNTISEKVDNLTTGLKAINDEYTGDATKINENFSAIEVDSKSMRESIEGIDHNVTVIIGEFKDRLMGLENAIKDISVRECILEESDKDELIKETVKRIIPALFKHIPKLIEEKLQETVTGEGESEPNVPDDEEETVEVPMEDPVVISESDTAAYAGVEDTVEVKLSDDDILLNKYDEDESYIDDEEEKAKIIKDAAEKGQLFPWMIKPGDTTPNPEKQEYNSSTFAPQPRKEGEDWGEEEKSFRDYVDENFNPEEDDDDSMTITTSSIITNNTPVGYYDPAKAARAKKYANKQNKKNNRNNDYNGGGKNKKNNKKRH
jgi:hypothetical protein